MQYIRHRHKLFYGTILLLFMAVITFYDTTDLDRDQLTDGLRNTDHYWEYREGKLSTENINPDTEVLSVFVSSAVSREIIEALPRLRVIACRSTGYNNVDLDAANEHNIAVLNVPTYGEQTVAEYTIALLLALVRKIPQVLRTENEVFDQTALLGHDLGGKVIGIIGTGHIGQRVIRIARGFGMTVLAYDAFPNNDLPASLDFTYTSIDDLLDQSDIVSLHVPYIPATHHIINADRLQQMKDGSVLVNTARGELIDTEALVQALHSGKLGGAALDVVEGEAFLSYNEEAMLLRSNALPQDLLQHSVEISMLNKMPNVIISPHNAFNTVEAIGRINQITAQNITEFWYGNTPNLVKASKKPYGKLIITRHAESEWNATGQWSGVTDVHLSEKGFHESTMLGLVLRELKVHIDVAYCSEQIRTRETLEGILSASQQFDVEVHRSACVNERDYGDYTGKNKWEMKELLGEEKFNHLRRGWNEPVPNGETLKKVYERVIPFYKTTILPQLLDGKNVLLVAHGNSIRALMKYIEKLSEQDIEKTDMIFGQILVYDIDKHGLMKDKKTSSINSPPPNA